MRKATQSFLLSLMVLVHLLTLSCGRTSSSGARSMPAGGSGHGDWGIDPETDIEGDLDSGTATMQARNQCLGIIDGLDTMQHPSVVLLAITDNDGNFHGRCTGTFVSSNTLVTAAHCVESTPTGNIIALLDECGESRTRMVPALKIVHHGLTSSDFQRIIDEYMAGSTANVDKFAKDMAIAIFPDGTAPATSSLLTRKPRVGDDATMVGFGIAYAADDPRSAVPDRFENIRKRMGHNKLTADSFTFSAKEQGISVFHNRTTANTRKAGDYSSIAQGDSGGPLFIDGKLAGVSSTGAVYMEEGGDIIDVGTFTDVQTSTSKSLIDKAEGAGADF